MNRLRLFSLMVAVAAVFALAVAVVSSASGAAMTLPEFSNAVGGNSTSGPGTLFGATEINCKKAIGSQGATSKSLGTYALNFEECTTLSTIKCHSLGQATGSNTIATTGQYHVLLEGGTTGAPTHVWLLWFLVTELHIECEFASTLVLVKGNVLGTIKEESETKFAVNVAATKKGQAFNSYENDNGTLITVGGLLAAIGTGTFETSYENSPGSLITAAKTKLEH
jgi:hypothetical protein